MAINASLSNLLPAEDVVLSLIALDQWYRRGAVSTVSRELAKERGRQ